MSLTIRLYRKQFKAKDISIISQNCIGGVFYHDMGLKFTSPTINLYFDCPDFIEFVKNLEHYINSDIQMEWGEEYPIGRLGDIAIYFQHYDSCSNALDKWNERKTRINWNKIVILSTDMESFTEEVYQAWNSIQYPKLLFSSVDREDPSVLYYPKYSLNGKVGNLIPNREFYKEGKLIDLLNCI